MIQITESANLSFPNSDRLAADDIAVSIASTLTTVLSGGLAFIRVGKTFVDTE